MISCTAVQFVHLLSFNVQKYIKCKLPKNMACWKTRRADKRMLHVLLFPGLGNVVASTESRMTGRRVLTIALIKTVRVFHGTQNKKCLIAKE